MIAKNSTDNQYLFALKVVELAKAQIVSDNHFLSAAIGQLKPAQASLNTNTDDAQNFPPTAVATPAVASPIVATSVVATSVLVPPIFATDAQFLYIDPTNLVVDFIKTEKPPTKDLLHTILHCVFMHPFVGTNIRQEDWNLACDISCELIVSQICSPRDGNRGSDIDHAFKKIMSKMSSSASSIAGTTSTTSASTAAYATSATSTSSITAEKVYAALRDGIFDEDKQAWAQLFCVDDHRYWYKNSYKNLTLSNSSKSNPSNNIQAELQDNWKRVSKSMSVNLQTISKKYGDKLGGLLQTLNQTNKPVVDYREFLRKFAIPTEVMKLSDDEFDTIFYTYGLTLYKNMPLVEPLEYRVDKRVREFVIAIDTSGSVYDDQVRDFVAFTYSVLKSSEAFDNKVKIKIIQCDTEIRHIDDLNSLDELRKWCGSMQVYGGGGTDFCPVFACVDTMLEQGELKDLGGLIYLTDGYGTYPSYVPKYKTAFVFCDENYEESSVPPWAMRVFINPNNMSSTSWRETIQNMDKI